MKGYYFRQLRADTHRIHEEIRQKHTDCPEYNNKDLAMVCFVGVNVVQRALSKTN